MANIPRNTVGEEVKHPETNRVGVDNVQIQPQENARGVVGTLRKLLTRERTREELTKHVRIGVIALLALGAIGPTVNKARLWEVHSEIEKRNQNVAKNGPEGNWLCNVTEDKVSSVDLQEFEVCGKRFKADKELGEIAVKVDQEMRADFEKYKTGRMGAMEKGKYWAYIQKSGGEANIECLRVNYGFRSNVEQYRIFLDSLNEEGRKAWDAQLPIDRKNHQEFVAAPPCQSNHERGRAVDVDNWGAAEPYFWKFGVPGGARGIFKDPWHFSKGEFQRGNMADSAAQWGWWEMFKLKAAYAKHKRHK